MRILRVEDDCGRGPFRGINATLHSGQGYHYGNCDIWPAPSQDGLEDYAFTAYRFAVPDVDWIEWWFGHVIKELQDYFVTEYECPDVIKSITGTQVVYNPKTAKIVPRLKIKELFS